MHQRQTCDPEIADIGLRLQLRARDRVVAAALVYDLFLLITHRISLCAIEAMLPLGARR